MTIEISVGLCRIFFNEEETVEESVVLLNLYLVYGLVKSQKC